MFRLKCLDLIKEMKQYSDENFLEFNVKNIITLI